jgi:hypothetical protein
MNVVNAAAAAAAAANNNNNNNNQLGTVHLLRKVSWAIALHYYIL